MIIEPIKISKLQTSTSALVGILTSFVGLHHIPAGPFLDLHNVRVDAHPETKCRKWYSVSKRESCIIVIQCTFVC